MAKQDELRELFAAKLKAALAHAITVHKRGLRWVLPLAIGVFAVFYLILGQMPWLFGSHGRGALTQFATILFSLVPAFFVWHYAPRALARSARRVFTETVLRPLGRLVDPAMDYEPKARISRDILDTSLLFDSVGEGLTSIRGDNLFKGTAADGNAFAFSTLQADKKVRHGCHLYGGTLFSGMFLRRTARESIDGLMMIVPRASGLTPEGLTERIRVAERDALLPVREIEVIHDPAFVRWFIVLAAGGDAPPPTPAMRERILALLEEYGYQPYYSRMGTEWHLGLMTARRQLEIPDCAPGDEKTLLLACERYYTDIQVVRELADAEAFA
ncbi:MAG: DUF3137 domain-containing protein [Planctomycetaceae bacterium]|nr:DUF3137 domain-containing protein [Planctomycetaceae bacterium]